MRRAVIHDSDEEQEQPKTVRRTRAALAAAAAEASPMRRSTRIRQGSVNRDGSSPESLSGSQAAPPVTRVTRRRAAAVASETTQFLEVPATRALRSRKTSLSSNVSEVIDVDSAPGTPRKSRRLPTIQSSPDTPKPKATRRSTRATSETKSPDPSPIFTSTRRTRANSTEPEPIVPKASAGTPSRRRRTLVSAPPTEPSVTEEASEEAGFDEVTEVPEETEATSAGRKSSRRSSSSSGKKSPEKEKPEIDESVIDGEISSVEKEDLVKTAEEVKLLETTQEVSNQDSSVLDITDGGKSIQKTSSPMIHVNKRGSFDKSKELGVQIESLLNKSSEELAHSPGDKENQKANISPEKVRKNLEVTVSNVNIVRSKPVGFGFVNQSFEKKLNNWLDDRGLARSRYEVVTPNRGGVEEDGKTSNLESRSPKKSDNEAKEKLGTIDSGKKNKKLRLNVEKTVVDSVVVREFTLSESGSSDDSQSEFSLAIEDDAVDKEKKTSAANTSSSKKSKHESDEEMSSDEDILERKSPKKHNLSSNNEKNSQGNDSKRFNLSLTRLEDQTDNKKRSSMEKKTNEQVEEPESKNNGPQDDKNDSQEAMDWSEAEKNDRSENSTQEALAQDLISFEESEPVVNEKNQSLKADESKSKSLIDSEIDSDVVVNTLFQNISADEWKKKRDRSLAKRQSRRKSSRLPSNNDDDSDEDDLITVGDRTMPQDQLESDSDSDSDSDDTLILKIPADKKRMSVDQTIIEEADTEYDEEEGKTKKKRKSLNKSTKSNTSLTENQTETEDEKNSSRKSIGKTQEEKIDDELSEAETQEEQVAKEKTKKKRKSLNESTKSNTSSIENETEAEDEKNSSRKSIGKSPEAKEDPKMDDESGAETQEDDVAKEKTKKKRKSLNKSTKSNTSLTEDQTEAEDAKNVSRKSIGKTQDEEIAVEKTEKKRNSLNKSTKSSTSLIENEMEVDEAENTNRKSVSKASEEKEDSIEEASEPMATENSIVSEEEEKVEEEKQPRSAKKTPKKSKKTAHVHEFSDESESDNETKEEAQSFVAEKSKSAKKSAVQMFRAPLNKNYSTIADVDSDSVREDVSESESSDDEKTTLPSFLFSVPSSGDEDEDYDPNATQEESDGTIDSDVARDLNLAGDDDLRYSDDDVAGDECRDSESEHSDEDDNGSDIGDFVVADDEVESSEEEEGEEEEESAKKPRFKRILDKSSSEDEEAETEPIQETETTPVEIAEKSVVGTPEEEEQTPVPSELRRRTLDYSPEPASKSLSDKKSKKRKSGEDLKPINVPAKTLLDQTVDLCTPEQAEPKTAKKSGEKRERSSDKFKKNLVEDLGALTPVQSGAASEEKTKTPKSSGKKEKQRAAEKTPEAANKKNRDSMQLIQDLAGLTKSSLSDLNKSMDTPNSETPATKFLKKEKLNESLPLMKLKRKSSKSFDKTALNQISGDEQVDEEPAENHERQNISEESGDDEEANDDIEENGDEVNGNGHREDREDDDTDEEPDENEDNVDEHEDGDNENEEEEESDEEEELSVKIHVAEKKRNSKGRLSLTEEPESKTRLSNGRPSTSTVINGNEESDEEVFSSKKKQASNPALLQLRNEKKRQRSTASAETPQSLKKTKKFKAAPQTEEADHSDSDEAPVSLGFGKAKTEAIQAMKEVMESVKAGKEAKKKKRREQLEKIKQDKETKAAKTNLKRLSEDFLENLPGVQERPKKRRKLHWKPEPIIPSRRMFSPGKTPPGLKIEATDLPVSSVGGTTHFSVINLEKVKKQPKKAAAAASFRDLMLARNPRQPISAFLMYKAKQKASGKQLPRKRSD